MCCTICRPLPKAIIIIIPYASKFYQLSSSSVNTTHTRTDVKQLQHARKFHWSSEILICVIVTCFGAACRPCTLTEIFLSKVGIYCRYYFKNLMRNFKTGLLIEMHEIWQFALRMPLVRYCSNFTTASSPIFNSNFSMIWWLR